MRIFGHTRHLIAAAAMLLGLTLLSGCGTPANHPHTFSGATMGTSYNVKYAGDKENDLQTLVDERLSELNQQLSTYQNDSVVSRFNAYRETDWFPVTQDTLYIVKQAQTISTQSGGAFDITVGPLVELWGFGAAATVSQPPASSAIDEAAKRTGFNNIEWRDTPPALKKNNAAIAIDLSAIAKGYAVDEVSQLLESKGINNYLVEVGGEIRAAGFKPGNELWRVAIERPAVGSRTVQMVLPLSDQAIATSGDYRNFFEYEGKRYSHSINPQTGWPADTGVGSVSVVASTAILADAWATALLVVGVDEAIRLSEKYGLAVHIIERKTDGDDIRLVETSSRAFKKLASQE